MSFLIDDLNLEKEGWRRVKIYEYPSGYWWNKEENRIRLRKFHYNEYSRKEIFPLMVKDGKFWMNSGTYIQRSGVVDFYTTENDCLRHESARLIEERENLRKNYEISLQKNWELQKKLSKLTEKLQYETE